MLTYTLRLQLLFILLVLALVIPKVAESRSASARALNEKQRQHLIDEFDRIEKNSMKVEISNQSKSLSAHEPSITPGEWTDESHTQLLYPQSTDKELEEKIDLNSLESQWNERRVNLAKNQRQPAPSAKLLRRKKL